METAGINALPTKHEEQVTLAAILRNYNRKRSSSARAVNIAEVYRVESLQLSLFCWTMVRKLRCPKIICIGQLGANTRSDQTEGRLQKCCASKRKLWLQPAKLTAIERQGCSSTDFWGASILVGFPMAAKLWDWNIFPAFDFTIEFIVHTGKWFFEIAGWIYSG